MYRLLVLIAELGLALYGGLNSLLTWPGLIAFNIDLCLVQLAGLVDAGP